MKKSYNKYTDKIKNHFKEVMRTKTSSESIAMGFAVGTFLSILPLPIIDILIGILIVLTFERINKYALMGAILIFWNPLTTAPFYYPANAIGKWIFEGSSYATYDITLFRQAYEFTRRVFVGSAIVGILVSIPSYFIVKKIVDNFRKN